MKKRAFRRDYGHHLAEEARAGRLSRRDFLVRGTIFGFSVTTVNGLLVACGSDSDGDGDQEATDNQPEASGTSQTSSSVAAGGPNRGGTARIGSFAPPRGELDPLIGDIAASGIMYQVLDRLTRAEPDGTLSPLLAEQWEPDETGSVWTFTIRSGVTFHDGTPMTTEDVAATFNRLADPEGRSSDSRLFASLFESGAVEAVDDTTVRFTLTRPNVDFPVYTTQQTAGILPASYDGGWEQNPIGTGAFVLDDYQTNSLAVLRRHDDYWDGDLPYLDGVEYHFFDGTQPLELAMLAGDIDKDISGPQVGSALWENPDFEVLSAPATRHGIVSMRVDEPPFDDPRVRRAVALALDRPGIVQAMLGEGQADLGNDHPFAPYYGNSPPETRQREQDLEQARALLAEAGREDGFEVTLTTDQASYFSRLAVLYQDMLEPIGIRVTPEVLDIQAFRAGDDPLNLRVPFGIQANQAPPAPSLPITRNYFSTGSFNPSHYSNPAYEQLGNDYLSTLDEQSRLDIATQLIDIHLEDTPTIITHWDYGWRTTRRTIKGDYGPGNPDILREAYFE